MCIFNLMVNYLASVISMECSIIIILYGEEYCILLVW
jgi:hypothetical protein